MLLEKKKKKKKSRINHDECPYSKDTQKGHNTEIQSNQPSSRSPTTCMNPQRKSPSVQPSVAAIMIAPKQKTAEPNDTAEPETSVRKVSILWTSYHHIHHFTGHAMQSRHIGGCCIHGCKHQPECQGFSDSFKTSSLEIHEKSQTYPTKKHDDQRAALHNLSQIR